MGTAHSHETSEYDDIWWRKSTDTAEAHQRPTTTLRGRSASIPAGSFNENGVHSSWEVSSSSRQLSHENAIKLKLFQEDLKAKRAQRQSALAEKKRELTQVDRNVQNESSSTQTENIVAAHPDGFKLLQDENAALRLEVAKLKAELTQDMGKAVKVQELETEISSVKSNLQEAQEQIIGFEQERIEYQGHVKALKEVIKVSKEMIAIREAEMHQLTQKLNSIETCLADREMQTMCTDLRHEYERQLRNIRDLRTLYEEKARISRIELQNKTDQLTEARQKLEFEISQNNELKQRVVELEEDVSKKYDEITNLQSSLGLTKAEYRGIENEMAAINQLFAQTLTGFSGCQDVDLDKLTKLLEENHDLLSDIVIKEDSGDTSSALPRLLLDLVSQVNNNSAESNDTVITESNDTIVTEIQTPVAEDTVNTSAIVADISEDIPNCTESMVKDQCEQSTSQLSSAKEIVSNLPKVWKVLIELLRHQTVQPVEIPQKDSAPQEGKNPCYKSVETPAGPRYVLSVSKTYIRLKDLIVEKKSLQKEMTKLKTLNVHLEGRLHDQEKRLVEVSSELGKTWHLVEKMQRQHEQLHTHEKILRYELSQKRKLLNDLKEELEYCRQNWNQAREKNTESEHECHKLRSEFTARRLAGHIDDVNNSAESGYSDELEGSSDDDEALPRPYLTQSHTQSNTDVFETNLRESESPSSEETEEDVHFQGDEISVEETIAKIVPEETSSNYPLSVENIDEDIPEEFVSTEKGESENIPSERNEGAETNKIAALPIETVTGDKEVKLSRDERFKILEEQCSALKKKYANQTERGTKMCSKLESLHQQYGSSSRKKISDTSPGGSDSASGSKEVEEIAEQSAKEDDTQFVITESTPEDGADSTNMPE